MTIPGRWLASGCSTRRAGETEALGMKEKVSYQINGNDIIVTSENGPVKGIAARDMIKGPGVANSGGGLMRKVR